MSEHRPRRAPTTGPAPARLPGTDDRFLGGVALRARPAPRHRRAVRPGRVPHLLGARRFRHRGVRRPLAGPADRHPPRGHRTRPRGRHPAGQASGRRPPAPRGRRPAGRPGRRRHRHRGARRRWCSAARCCSGRCCSAWSGWPCSGGRPTRRSASAGSTAPAGSTSSGPWSATAARRRGPGSRPASALLRLGAGAVRAADRTAAGSAWPATWCRRRARRGRARADGRAVAVPADRRPVRGARRAGPLAGARRHGRAPARLGAADPRADPEARADGRPWPPWPAPRSATSGPGCTASSHRRTTSLASALRAAAAEVEDSHGVPVEVVTSATRRLRSGCGRSCSPPARRWSTRPSTPAPTRSTSTPSAPTTRHEVFVRDRGRGFDRAPCRGPARRPQQHRRPDAPPRRHRGDPHRPGEGTEVRLHLTRPDDQRSTRGAR